MTRGSQISIFIKSFMMYRLLWFLRNCSYFIFSLFLITSCNKTKKNTHQIFRYNESSGIPTLDPAFARNQAIMWPVHQLYSTLIELDEQMHFKPLLAKHWEFSADRKTIHFDLRTDVFFHDDPVFRGNKGRKMVATDVSYSLSRIANPETASPGAWIFNNRLHPSQPFEAPNDSTFLLHLKEPFQPIVGMLTMPYCSILPREAVEKYGTDFRRHPVGTGPFRFQAWEEGQGLVLVRHEHYFEKDGQGRSYPYLDGVYISFYESKAIEFMEFTQKRLHFVNDLDASFKDEILTHSGKLKKNWEGRLSLQKHPYLNVEYLGILSAEANPALAHSPLAMLKIRQAIQHSIDRKKLMFYLRNSIGTAANSGFVPLGLPSYDSSEVRGYDYDLQKARELIKEAGYDDQHPVPEIKLITVPAYVSLASYVANSLKQSGLTVSVETMQKSLLLEQTSKSQIPFFRGSWIADYPDVENFLGVFYSKNPAPPNYTRYANAAYDRLYEKALNEQMDSVRYQYYRSMDKQLMNDAIIIPLWYDMVLRLVQPEVQSFYPNSLNMLELRTTRLN